MSDTNDVYIINENEFVPSWAFVKGAGNYYLHLTSDMLENALLEQQKETLRDLKKVIKGEHKHEQKAKR